MRASVFVGVSVDGFMARPNGDLDFLPADGGEEHGYEAFFASVDALVIGRGTFDVEQMGGDPREIVAHLDAQGVRHAYVDGGVSIQRFLRAGLIQRLIVTRVPVLIGQGIPRFGALDADVPLRHVATRSYASGLVQSEYAVSNSE